MSFKRKSSTRWQNEVPGTRWFKADLHLHTLDDHPGGRHKRPDGLHGPATEPAVLRDYARSFLRAAVERKVEVLGLTPHAVRTGPESSAVWTIVEVWNEEADEDSIPFRDKIRAVFPGFEPSVNVGRKGIHLLLLFDPEIGRARFVRLFDTLMGGVQPWRDGKLQLSGLNAEEIFKRLRDFHARENMAAGWDYFVLAPHAFSGSGLFNGLKSQALQQFPSDQLSGIELGDNQVVADVTKRRPWLMPSMKELRLAFYHASDAYGVAPHPEHDGLYKVGSRCTMLKLDSPRIEGLRQAFLAHESRLRLMYQKAASGDLRLRSDLPVAYPSGRNGRPWIRSVRVQGGTSFHRGQVFRFSPDLTCIIGGSMTGKSTLLDGLRFHLGGPEALPSAGSGLRGAVEARARQRFLSGNPVVELDSPAGDLSRSVDERFGVRFFSQGELKELAEDAGGIEHLLFHLVPGRSDELFAQEQELRDLDRQLEELAGRLGGMQEGIAEADESFQQARRAREAMKRFAKAGTEKLPPAAKDVARTRSFARTLVENHASAERLREAIRDTTTPAVSSQALAAEYSRDPAVSSLLSRVQEHVDEAVRLLEQAGQRATSARDAAVEHHGELVRGVQQALVEAGGSSDELNEFEAFSRAAQHHDSYKAALDQRVAKRDATLGLFKQLSVRRAELLREHRSAVAALCQEVEERFAGRVRIAVNEEGRKEALDQWIRSLRRGGLTRWWNSLDRRHIGLSHFHPVLRAMDADRTQDALRAAGELEMSDAVASTLLEELATRRERLKLWSMRCPDRYRIQWVEDGSPKDLDELSGGRRVAVVLMLLLESDDATPLVVDQPEDELDNRVLNETIIPALHRLKGRRQVIFATHNANIVVNGDADRVIALEADATRGRVAQEGAIDDTGVREAILRTLDGGKEAFRLRRAKYGF